MTTLFSHVSEFGPEGYELVPAMAIVGERPILWAPSAQQIELAASGATAQGRVALSPADIAELVRLRKLRIVGRREWLTEPAARRRSAWPGAAWTDYDEQIAMIALDDLDQLPQDRRVRFAEQEHGREWAAQHVAQDSELVQDAGAALRAGTLPQGIIEKAADARRQAIAAGAPPERAALAAVLRDLYNHEYALRESKADVPVTFEGRALLNLHALEIDGAPRVATLDDAPEITAERFLELLNVAATLRRPRGLDDVLETLERKDVGELRSEMWRLVSAPTPVALTLLAEIEKGKQQVSTRDILKLERGSLRGLLIAMLAWCVGHEDAALALAVFVLHEVADRASGVAQKYEIGEARNYRGPQWPVVLAYGQDTAKYREIRELADALRRYRRASGATI